MTRFSLTAILLVVSTAAVFAQKASPECSKDIKVNEQRDLDGISNCKTFTGTITVDSTKLSKLELKGVEEMNGDLILQGNSDLQSFSAPQLKKVKGEVRIINHTILDKVDLTSLTEAKGLTLAVLPALEQIRFPAGLSKVDDLRIEDTRSPSISGLNAETYNTFQLTNNKYMKEFDLASTKEIKTNIVVLANGNSMNFKAPNLARLKMATFRNLGQLDLPALTSVTGDMSFHENQFNALNMDNIELIGGTLTIANNDRLAETSFKALSKVGGALSIGNNTQLHNIDGFPKLQEVDGTVDMAGSFDNYKLPVLADIRGGMRLQTTSSQFGCSDLEKKLKNDNVVKGNTWSCASSLQENQMSPTIGQNAGAPQTISGGAAGTTSSRNGNGDGNQHSAASRSIAAQGVAVVVMAMVLAIQF
ncbi:uncharacterized protein BYT42DRAFT_550374 [Radiomyces spectabilis]|uniref:uncharacterized protein n=1 Tax=Radiomyces spectabilis TaxID=64574 RepID=UPI00221F831C|nr:uncharacterized protein BYT42DRAFT_550374 [Radiomyces spectabilis]KAI8364769.1 hypothetical protein BYT42DRAFT_550374 [Radiomyces spectabilis]